ncbi:MAG: alpha/beta fold hydrolase [Acidimicrobiia bacterium]|nr:alpha/beta fold hydrolase [Acidimicrobiia bacterium]
MRLVFGECELDPARLELRRGGVAVHLEPQVFDVLAYLIEHRDRVVPKTELLDRVWGDRFVGESALTSRLKAARRAVGDDGAAQRVIRTAHGRGYQFVADVHEQAPEEPAHREPRETREPREPREPHQEIRFLVAPDGARIAYATSGAGPPLVKAANWMTHLDNDWESPVWRHWLLGLAEERSLVRYDERGCGLSDWDVGRCDVDAWVEDLELVVEATGVDRFPLIGLSQGGAVAIAYAVRHPERVSHVVLVGAYARGRLVRADNEDERREAALDIELARVGWRREDEVFRQVFSTQFLPDGSPEQWRAFNELQRSTTSADNAVRFLEAFARIDVTAEAPLVRCPTLVLHARGDLRVPMTCARELAALVPGSRLVTLGSRNHILTASEPAWGVFLDELGRFLAEA